MSFLHPFILTLGAIAVSIPIIIHLLMRRRRQPVMWGAMRFVIEAYQRTRRRLIVQKWLLLALRCLLVLLAGLIIARPLIGAGASSTAGARRVHIVIDNSISSQIKADAGRSIERHIETARQVLDSLGEGDQASLLLAGSPVSEAVWPASGNLAAVRDALARVVPTDSAADLRSCLTLVAGSSSAGAPGGESVVVISDFLSGSTDVRAGLARLRPDVRIIATPPGRGGANVGIAGVTPARRFVLTGDEGVQTASISLVRSGAGASETAVTSLRLWTAPLAGVKPEVDSARPDSLSPAAVVRWAAGQRQANLTVPITVAPGTITTGGDVALIASIDNDANPADNVFRTSMPTRGALRVGILGDRVSAAGVETPGSDDPFTPAQWLKAALRPTESAAVDVLEIDTLSLDSSRRSTLDAIIVLSPASLDKQAWERLRAFVDAGGLLMVMPPTNLDAHAWTDAMVAELRLPWRFARTAVEVKPGAGVLSPAGPNVGESSVTTNGDLLSGIRREMRELAQPVSVLKLLPIVSETADAAGATTPANAGDGANTGAAGVPRGVDGDGGRGAAGTPAASGASGSNASTAKVGASKDGAATASSVTLLKLADGTPILSVSQAAPTAGAPSPGAVVYFACALNSAWTDVMAKPLMVPMAQELMRQGVSASLGSGWVLAGTALRIPPGASDLAVLTPTGATLELNPAAPTVSRAMLIRAGDARGVIRGHVAINPDAAAASADAIEVGAVAAWLGSMTTAAGADAAPSVAGTPSVVAFIGGVDGGATNSPLGASRPIAELLQSQKSGSPISSLWVLPLLLLAMVEMTAARWASVPAVGAQSAQSGGASVTKAAGGTANA